jgi:hypothetical protein
VPFMRVGRRRAFFSSEEITSWAVDPSAVISWEKKFCALEILRTKLASSLTAKSQGNTKTNSNSYYKKSLKHVHNTNAH